MTIDQGGMDDLSPPNAYVAGASPVHRILHPGAPPGQAGQTQPDSEDDKRQTLLATHRREAWLADAARRVGQLQW